MNHESNTKSILFLLNDNDLILTQVIKNKFKKEQGWESLIATNYTTAIELFESHKPHGVMTEIIINDNQGRTGFDFIYAIKNSQFQKNEVPVIVFTELSQEGDKKKAEDLGVKHYFVKSQITLNELIDQLKKIVD